MIDRRSAFLLAHFILATTLAMPVSASGFATEQSLQQRPDRLLIIKSKRKLYLLKRGKVLKSYKVSLGGNPVGHKVREGDGRTPEGNYVVDWRNPNSRFFRSIHISYPNDADRQRARKLGVSPGGDIMIHGLPNEIGRLVYRVRGQDWTEGCIALSNEAMSEVWETVADNTPIDIVP